MPRQDLFDAHFLSEITSTITNVQHCENNVVPSIWRYDLAVTHYAGGLQNFTLGLVAGAVISTNAYAVSNAESFVHRDARFQTGIPVRLHTFRSRGQKSP